jgi:putative ABC transport system substrate-binding protein
LKVVASPLAARAQQGERSRRVGVLTTLAENDSEDQALLGPFRNKLAVFGWIEGQNVEFVYRQTMGSTETCASFRVGMAGLQADVVLAVGGTATSALKQPRRCRVSL